MKLQFILTLSLFFLNIVMASDLQVAIKAQQTQKIPLGLVFIGSKAKSTKNVLFRLEKDLQYSGQCKTLLMFKNKVVKSSDISKLFPTEINLAIFLSYEDGVYIWRLYDTLLIEMLAGGKVVAKDKHSDFIAHSLANQIWPALMGKESSFGSKIAYCKQIWKTKLNQEKPYKQIWIADFDGSNPRLFVDIPTVSFAPRWSMNKSCPLLFYSENTLSNVQLVMTNMFHKRKVMCCFDGLNMQPTFCDDGKEVVFCLSKDGSSQLYHSYVDRFSKKRRCDRLTHNDSNNFGPCFIDQDHVAFVSDFENSKPQIYILQISTSKLKKITDGSYCACPAYCVANNKLVYSKMLEGQMQLIEYDCATKSHRQLTKGPGSKEEPSWSVCGNYIVFGMNEGLSSRIAQLNLLTGKIRFLTPATDNCTYPSYSPVYDEQLGILQSF